MITKGYKKAHTKKRLKIHAQKNKKRQTMQRFVNLLKENDLLKIIAKPVDTELEMAHIAYIEAKKGERGKALLFTKPTHKGQSYEFPVLMNAF